MKIEAEVRAALNEIIDPCSAAAGTPLGLVDMGIVRDVAVDGSTLRIELLPTFPACRFVPIFEAEIRKRLGDTRLTVSVDVADPSVVWDESMMSPSAVELLENRRRAARPSLGPTGSTPTGRALPVIGSGQGVARR